MGLGFGLVVRDEHRLVEGSFLHGLRFFAQLKRLAEEIDISARTFRIAARSKVTLKRPDFGRVVGGKGVEVELGLHIRS